MTVVVNTTLKDILEDAASDAGIDNPKLVKVKVENEKTANVKLYINNE